MSDTPPNPESVGLKKAPRVSRLRLLVLGILLLTLIGVVVVRTLESRAHGELFEEFLQTQTENCRRSVDDFYRPVASLLALVPQWADRGVLSFDDPERIRDQFVPILENHPQVVALTIVGNAGRSYELRRAPGGPGEAMETAPGQGDVDAGWEDAVMPVDRLDRRRAPWYQLATDEGQLGKLVVTEVPVDEENDPPHLLAAFAWSYTEDGGTRIGAAALEMTARVTRELADELSVSQSSVVMVIESDESVTWLAPGEERHFAASAVNELNFSGEEDANLIARALIAWSEQGHAYELSFSVDQGGLAYRCRFLPLELGTSNRSVALLVPPKDLDPRLGAITRPYQYALMGVVALGLLIIGVVVQQYRHRLHEIRRHRKTTGLENEGLEALIAQGESERLEFKSTLRWNLKANKPGKEIELAWLKTLVAYLNTEGGTLLVGVADDGSVVGIEQDGFRNEDKYLLHFNNCVKQHIGIEFARFLSFDLRPVQGQRILVVDVRPATDPAFLVLEDEEEFYVRVGPASRRISPRKALEYLRERG